ncbi:MAG: hypothetical protein ACLQUR_05535 [Limisphaerales bacterium]
MNILIPLKQELIEQQPWLFQELNFKIVEDTYASKDFGNSFVTLESSSLRVKFIRDRGQIFIEVASPFDPDNWWNINDICEFILHKKIRPEFDLQAVATLLRNNLPALTDYLGPKLNETRRKLKRRIKQREHEILKRAREDNN